MRYRWEIAAFWLLLCFGLPAWGQIGDPLLERPHIDRTVTVDEAVAIALQNNPVQQAASAEVRGAKAQTEMARAQLRPFLSANTFFSGGSNANIVTSPAVVPPAMTMALPKDAFFDQNLMVMLPLYTAGRLTALVRQATAEEKTARAGQRQTEQELALQVRTSFYLALSRRALIAVQEARLTENEERLRLDTVRLAQEAIPAFYVRRDEAEVASAKQEVTNARRDALKAMIELRAKMGIYPDSRLEIVLPEDNLALDERLKALTGKGVVAGEEKAALRRTAQQLRPELQAAGERVRKQQAATAAIRGSYGPQVNLFGMGDYQRMRGMNGSGGTTFGLAASLPLYSGGQKRAELAVSVTQEERLRAEATQRALLVLQEVDMALIDLEAAEQNVQTLQAAVLAAAEEYRVAQTRYAAGRSVITEALDAQAARIRAESGLVTARYEREIALAQLQRAIGK